MQRAGDAGAAAEAALAMDMEAYLEPIRRELGAPDGAVAPEAVPAGRFDPTAFGHRPSGRGGWPDAGDDEAAALPGSVEDLVFMPMTALAQLVRTGRLSGREAVEAYGARLERLNASLNAFITPTVAAALAAADSAPRRRLAGVPMAIKDIVEVAGVPATGGSRLLRERVPTADAVVWQRLRAEGALLIGKSHTHEFAAGPTGENEAFGPAHNPWATDRLTGGSSSGSAAAVAAALASAAIGTDTGGSIRIPAALCGTVGLKATYGRVDASGVYPLSWSLDHVGPITRTVRDAGRLLDILAPSGASCEGAAAAGAHGDLHGVRVGVAREWIDGGCQEAIARAFDDAVATLAGLGAEVREVRLPASAELLMAVNRAITLPEASAWHERFLAAGRAGEYGRNVRPRMEAGLRVPAVLYLQAQRLRPLLAQRFAAVWREVDILALPTVPVEAPVIGSAEVALGAGRSGPTAMALLGWCGPFNVLGTPALSLPCALTPGGLPAALQLVAAPAEDAFLCYVGAAAEAAIAFGHRRPPLGAN